MASTKLTAQIRQQLLKNNSVETREQEDSSLGQDFKDQVVTNAKAAPRDIASQLLGIDHFAATHSENQSGELAPGQELTLPKKAHKEMAQPESKKVEHKAHIRAGIDYFAEISRSSERSNSRENQELRYQINQIMEELVRIYKASNAVVQAEYAGVVVTATPSTPGKYHVNYFTWVLSVLRDARRKVENAGAWLAVSKKKNGYQAKAQKHGTKYTQSSERQAVTQTG